MAHPAHPGTTGLTGNVIYNPAYTYKFQLKTTKEVLTLMQQPMMVILH